jgi:broad specificity phosphatase PhoE
VNPERLVELANIPDPRLTGPNTGIFFETSAPGVTEVLLIRHGHIPVSGSAADPDLTDIGLEQAEALGVYLAGQKPLTAIYSSPFRRTLQTVEAITRHQPLPIKRLDDLREVEVYIPEGTSLREFLGDEAWQAYAERMRTERTWDARGEHGESTASVRRRAIAAVEGVVSRHPGGRIALVSHGPLIITYFAALLESPYDLIFHPRLTSISVVWALGSARRPGAINALPHLGVL